MNPEEDVMLRAKHLLEDGLESEKQCAAFYEREAAQERGQLQNPDPLSEDAGKEQPHTSEGRQP
ncbi:hypothetical protein ACFFLM_04320 [Deinococcus oregonensis]|uniref:Uncharacterized protein n=1 Tax=Deinococcus oregonensis TaxID=1805970 RepID=A0ABV6AW12_9DEIO